MWRRAMGFKKKVDTPSSSGTGEPPEKQPRLSHRVIETERFQECFDDVQIKPPNPGVQRPEVKVYGTCLAPRCKAAEKNHFDAQKQRSQCAGRSQDSRKANSKDFDVRKHVGRAVRNLISIHEGCFDPPLNYDELDEQSKTAELAVQVNLSCLDSGYTGFGLTTAFCFSAPLTRARPLD